MHLKRLLRRWLPPTTLRQARRVVVAVVGGTLLLGGVVMLVTPGPGIVVIIAGLSVLAAEFVWARRLLRRFKIEGKRLKRKVYRG